MDCYSVPGSGTNLPLSDDEKIQQKILYTMFTDLFEIAFIQYKASNFPFDEEVKKIRDEQWQGWEAYIEKFLGRPAFCATYTEIKDEYDHRLIRFIDAKKKCNYVDHQGP